ncbi:TetR/AcrR family transcriptional regulator [Paenibacillus maysiensis]|uniref:TetR/AcrR family transcriptional regulator n=1 Tax=Paenibacillus maysiensis TaxID=1155954 RepID=UPI0004AEF19B|nr:TetR/AcrR family transcriptional regulator [Paenibacillus maysiensis]
MMKKNKTTNRDVVLHTATSLFLTRGYHTTSMDEIVAVSNVSKTNIYYYFKSKEELLSAILDQLIQTYNEMIYEVASRKDQSVQERFEILLQLLTQQETDCLGGCPFITLYTQMPKDNPLFRDKVSQFFQSQITTVEMLLNEGMKKSEIQTELPARSTAQFIVSAIEGALFLQHASQDPSILENLKFTLAFLLK